MKMTVDIDCTPEEARRFLGLPDLSSVHDVYTDKLKKFAADGVTPDMLDQMMKTWSPMGEMGMSVWRQMFEQVGKSGKA